MSRSYRPHLRVLGALCVIGLMAVAANAQTGVLFVKSNRVAIGIANPLHTLHVQKGDGSTRVFVREASGTKAERTLYQLQNNGPTLFQLFDSSTGGSRWNFEAEGPSFRVNKAGSGGEELIVRNRLDASGLATLTVAGSVSATNVTFTSSRESKTDFRELNARSVLDKVASLPMTEWTFKDELNSRRHIGPVAEDFNAAFALGGNGKEISLIDATGVTMTAVQGLHELVREKEAEVDELKALNTRLAERLERLERQVAELQR